MVIKRKTKENIWITLCVVIFLSLQAMTILMDKMNITTFNGVFSALQYGVCLILIYINHRKGVKVSMILMCISILMVARAMLFSRTLYPLPGLFNTIFYLITIITIERFYNKRDIENMSDYVTNAFNRRGLYKNINNRIGDRESFLVIYLCIDNFKYIADNYGHAYGDELLRKIAKRIKRKMNEHDSIARINGSDFVVILERDVDSLLAANEILWAVKEKAVLVLNERSVECYPECYAGMTSYNLSLGKIEEETLIKWADVAMCEALTQKSQEVNVFSQEMMDALNRQLEIEKLIKDGLEKDYFYMVYQPQFVIGDKHLRGFESLIRMKTPDGISISPAEFIPVAEKSELILNIDDYVLNRVLREFKTMLDENPELTVSINVSAKNICNLEFVDKIKGLLDTYEFPPMNLEIEITEYCMVDSMEISILNIKKLREIGIQVALDDFGTGYTSLNYVAKMPINSLKVDKSLIDDITSDDKIKEFVQAVISLGHVMGCEVISEGVEDEMQLQYLSDNGCDFVQGYVWGKPLTYGDAVDLITTDMVDD